MFLVLGLIVTLLAEWTALAKLLRIMLLFLKGMRQMNFG